MDKNNIFKMILATLLLGSLLVTHHYLNHPNKVEAKYIFYIDDGTYYVLDKESKKLYMGFLTGNNVKEPKDEFNIEWHTLDMPNTPNIKGSNSSDWKFITNKKEMTDDGIIEAIKNLNSTIENDN